MTGTSQTSRGRALAAKPILCVFYSRTSGPSRQVEAFLAEVLQRRQNHETFALQWVNCDDHPELVERFAVKEVPTLIVIEEGRVRGRLEGRRRRKELEPFLKPWLKGPGGGGEENGTRTPRYEAISGQPHLEQA